MEARNLIHRVLTIVTLLALLLPAPMSRAERPSRQPSAVGNFPAAAFSSPAEAKAPVASATGWDEVGTGSATDGGISDNSGASYRPSVAIAPDGTVHVAWEDYSGGDLVSIFARYGASDFRQRWATHTGGAREVPG
jgi:hypothetical protein